MKARTNVNHRCPNCGKDKWGSIGPGWKQRDATCQACGATYTLTREMHQPGLQARERKKNAVQ